VDEPNRILSMASTYDRARASFGFGEQRDAFDLPGDVAYFNTANLSPLLHRVRDAGVEALARRGSPWTISSEDWFSDIERLRGLFARLVAAEAEGVALVPATNYGFAVAAGNLGLGEGDVILVLAEEYPSGIYTWRSLARRSGARVLTVAREEGQSWTDAVLSALDERVAAVSVPQVHWTDGAVLDLKAIADRAHGLGCALVIDASQSAGAMPLDVGRLRPDFLVSVGYKWLLGPFGLSFLYVAEQHRDGEPLEENWISRAGSEDFSNLTDYRDEYQPGARRFDMGQRTSFHLVPMAIAALDQILAWEVPRIAATLTETTAMIAERCAGLGLAVAPAAERGPHMLGASLPADARTSILPALRAANCHAAVRGASLRIAPHLHVTPADVDRLSDALARGMA
jgi:selenocysteine lyase/cysteine desulfurase